MYKMSIRLVCRTEHDEVLSLNYIIDHLRVQLNICTDFLGLNVPYNVIMKLQRNHEN